MDGNWIVFFPRCGSLWKSRPSSGERRRPGSGITKRMPASSVGPTFFDITSEAAPEHLGVEVTVTGCIKDATGTRRGRDGHHRGDLDQGVERTTT